jgi:hypothetical protein
MRLAAGELAQEIDPQDLLPNDNEDFKAGTPRRIQAMSTLGLLTDWTEKAARISKLALDAGIEERQIKLAERQGEAIIAAIRAVVIGLNLPEEMQAKAFQLAAGALRELTDGGLPQAQKVVSE